MAKSNARIPAQLLTALRDGEVIPFVGAGVSREVRELSGEPLFPSWPELLSRAASLVEENGGAKATAHIRRALGSTPPDYYRAAELVRRRLKDEWYTFLRDQLDQDPDLAVGESLELARAVWSLGSSLVITTNCDRVLQWVCPDAPRLQTWKIQAVHSQVQALRKRVRTPTVWHLHGHIEDPFSVIFTLNDYRRLYPHGGVAQRYRAALKVLHTFLVTHTFLFIGFSLDDAYFALELRELSEAFQGVAGPHYVLTRKAERKRIEALRLPVKILEVEEFGPPLLEYLDRLVEDVFGGRRRGALVHAAPAPALASAAPARPGPPEPPFLVPYRQKGKQVIGRAEVLERIRAALSGDGGPYGPAASLQGIGGLGKTQMAVEYAFEFRGEYPNGVFWIDAAQSIAEQLIAFADAAGWTWHGAPPALKLDTARARLRTTSKCLIVFDDVESVRQIEPYLPATEARPHLLITSRSMHPGFAPIALNVLDREASLALLCQEAGQTPTGRREQRAAERIVARFDGLPLALELAGAYLLYRQVSWEDYDRSLERSLPAGLPRQLSSFTRHTVDLFSTLRVDEGILAEEALLREILDVLTWSATSPMSVELLAPLVGAEHAADLTAALGLGCSLRLLRRVPHADAYAIHSLVAEVRQVDVPLSDRGEWVRAVCGRVAAWFEARREDLNRTPGFEDQVDHLVAWQALAERHDPLSDCRLTWLLAYTDRYRGYFRVAADQVHAALAKCRRHCPDDLQLRANILDFLGTIYFRLDHHERAISCARRALRIRRRALGDDHRDTAQSYSNLGVYYRAVGDLPGALRAARRGLRIRTRLGRNSDVAVSLTNIAAVYRFMQKPQLALKYARRSMRILEAEVGPRHEDTATVYGNVGLILFGLSRTEEAWRYIERSMKIRRERFGTLHPETAMSYHNAALVLLAMSRKREANAHFRRALAVRRRTLGLRHRFTLQTALKLASVLGQSGHPERALKLLRGFLQELPRDHPDRPVLEALRNEILERQHDPGEGTPSPRERHP